MIRQSILVILLFFPSLASTQTPLGLRGIKIGANYSAFREGHTDFNRRFTVGLFAEHRLVKFTSIGYEAFYTRKGGFISNEPMAYSGAATSNDPIYLYDVDVSMAFIEFPFWLKFYIPLGNNIELNFFSGPSILIFQTDHTKIIQKQEYRRENHRFIYLIEPTHEIDDKFKSGYQIGFGVKVSHFYFDIRYDQLRKKIGDHPKFMILPFRSHAIYILLGFDVFGAIGKKK